MILFHDSKGAGEEGTRDADGASSRAASNSSGASINKLTSTNNMLYMIIDSRNNDHSSIEEGTADRQQYTTLEENVEEEVSIKAHLREIQERMVFIQSNVATMESLELNMIEEYLDDVDGARDDENGTICGDVLKDDVGSLESSQIQEYLNDNDAHDDEDGTTRKEILKYDVGCDDNAPEG